MKSITNRDGKDSLITVGCEDGSVAVLDSNGTVVRLGAVDGMPVDIETLETVGNVLVLLVTDKGEIKCFEAEE